MKKILLFLLIIGLFFGCASVGNQKLANENENTIIFRITEGVSTKADVRAEFGSPLKTFFTDNGSEIWTYELINMYRNVLDYIPVISWFGSSANGTKKELVVLFDESDTVKRYSMNVSDIQRKTGIFNQQLR